MSTFFVIVLHFLLVLLLFRFDTITPLKRHSPIVEHAVLLVSPPPQLITHEDPPPPSLVNVPACVPAPVSPLQNPKPAPPKKKTVKKVSTSKPKKISSPPKPKKSSNNTQLLSELQKTLTSLESKGLGVSPSSSSSKIETLASEKLTFEERYQAKLVTLLENRLKLSEDSEVKLALTLKRNGAFESFKLRSSANEKTKTYLESTLHTLTFPPFENHFGNEKKHTFNITILIGKKSH